MDSVLPITNVSISVYNIHIHIMFMVLWVKYRLIISSKVLVFLAHVCKSHDISLKFRAVLHSFWPFIKEDTIGWCILTVCMYDLKARFEQ